MYPRSFLCEEAKIKQRTPLKKELCEIGEEAIWESRFTSFFLSFGKRYSFRVNIFSAPSNSTKSGYIFLKVTLPYFDHTYLTYYYISNYSFFLIKLAIFSLIRCLSIL